MLVKTGEIGVLNFSSKTGNILVALGFREQSIGRTNVVSSYGDDVNNLSNYFVPRIPQISNYTTI